jgi:hypothetical protein
VGVVVVVVVVVVVAQEVLYVSPDLRTSELRKSGSVCIFMYFVIFIAFRLSFLLEATY